MSNNVFPDLPMLALEVERSEGYETTIHETISGREQRTSWRDTPRYRYRLRYNFARQDTAAPAPNAAQSEVGIILKFLEDHRGAFDSFLFVDPYDAVQRRVRFVSDSLSIRRLANRIWRCELELISVV